MSDEKSKPGRGEAGRDELGRDEARTRDVADLPVDWDEPGYEEPDQPPPSPPNAPPPPEAFPEAGGGSPFDLAALLAADADVGAEIRRADADAQSEDAHGQSDDAHIHLAGGGEPSSTDESDEFGGAPEDRQAQAYTRKQVFRLGFERLRFAAAHLGGFAADRMLDRIGPHVQRPPGALAEIDFLLTCTRCNACADACPPNAILQLTNRAGMAAGTPFLNPNRFRVCTACADTPCITACPTGALLPTAIEDVTMGLARIDRDTCRAWNDVPCTRCLRACPFPNDAILQDTEGRVYVDPRHCIGCGRCVPACPTRPVSVKIEPAPRG